MSQPKRVEYYQVGSDGMVRNHDIDYNRGIGSLYVAACDYDALAAENERLRSASFVTAVPSEEYERLKAENERLRKAGDDLAVAWARVRTDYHTWDVAVKAWDAAKKGRDSK